MDTQYFDSVLWKKKINNPLWYMGIDELKNNLVKLYNIDKAKYETEKKIIYDFFEQALVYDEIALGDNVGFFDTERKPVDTIVVHHTSNAPGMSLVRLSAIELIRLYGPYFSNPTLDNEAHIKGTPVFSGHVRGGKQVFYPYHWIIRDDGTAERLLEDKETGWHCGKWEINCKSVGITFDNDFENSKPTNIELQGMAKVIKEYYPFVGKGHVVGHMEVNPKTTCPSQIFLTAENNRGWKEDLLDLL